MVLCGGFPGISCGGSSQNAKNLGIFRSGREK
jgi:hypothetical protein